VSVGVGVVPLMLRSPKLKKWASDPEWAQNGGSKLASPKIGPSGVTCPWAQNGGAKKPRPSGPLWGQLPIVGFWAPEGEWGLGIGKGGSTAVCILGGGRERPPYVFLGGPLPKEEGCTACIPWPSRCATGSEAGLLAGYIGE